MQNINEINNQSENSLENYRTKTKRKTGLILAAVVLGIYLLFIIKTALHY